MPETSRLIFRKSSYSVGKGQDCVEVAIADLPTGTAVRDSKHPEQGHLRFDASEWQAFLHEVKFADL